MEEAVIQSRIPLLCSSGLSGVNYFEIQGSSASGKSELSYEIISQYVMPKIFDGIRTYCFQSNVLVIDLDGKFSLPRFKQLLLYRFYDFVQRFENKTICKEMANIFVDECLQRLFIMKYVGQSSGVYFSLLKKLPDLIKEEDIRLLVIEDCFSYCLKNIQIQDKISNELTSLSSTLQLKVVSTTCIDRQNKNFQNKYHIKLKRTQESESREIIEALLENDKLYFEIEESGLVELNNNQNS